MPTNDEPNALRPRTEHDEAVAVVVLRTRWVDRRAFAGSRTVFDDRRSGAQRARPNAP